MKHSNKHIKKTLQAKDRRRIQRQCHGKNFRLQKQKDKQLNLVHYLRRVMARFFPDLLEKLRALEDFRKRSDYDLAEILLSTMGMFILQMGSRNAFDNQRGERKFQRNFEKLFGIRMPHPDTCDRVLRRLEEDQLEILKRHLVQGLIRKKLFDRFRYRGYILVAVDATGVMSFREQPDERALHKTSTNGKTTWFYQALEAKLVTPNGFAISLATQWLENAGGAYDKQDCERKAFQRLAEKLKRAFPQLRLCLLADGLYPNASFFEICRQNDWRYIVTFKPGNLPTVWEEIEGLLALSSGHTRRETRYNPLKTGMETTVSDFQWLNGIDYRGYSLNWIQCRETLTQANTDRCESHVFVHLTDWPVTDGQVPGLSFFGRLRWKIENEGFNTQKNQGYDLQHKYSRVSFLATKNYYQCLQLAHLINQLMILSQRFQSELTGKMTLRHLWKRLITAITCDSIDETDLFLMAQKPGQIRFVT